MRDELVAVRDGGRGCDVAVIVYCLEGGGVQRQTLTLAAELARRGLKVDYVAVRAAGEFAACIPTGVRLVELLPSKAAFKPTNLDRVLDQLRAVPALVDYLRERSPAVLLSGGSHANALTVVAHRISRSASRIVLRLTTHMSRGRGRFHPIRWLSAVGASFFYPLADSIVSVSDEVRSDFARMVPWAAALVRTIHEPVVRPEIATMAREDPGHPWLAPGLPPVICAVGRISAQKDFATLLRAVALVRSKKNVRLIVVGAAINPRRVLRLKSLAERLGISDAVDFVGHVHNPYAFMARAAVFALSSRFEGCPNVLTEAHYCGCRIVATSCPGGIQELVIDHHLPALLVPVGEPAQMAKALGQALEMAPSRQAFRGMESFSSETAAAKYIDVFALPVPPLSAPAAAA